MLSLVVWYERIPITHAFIRLKFISIFTRLKLILLAPYISSHHNMFIFITYRRVYVLSDQCSDIHKNICN